MQFDHRQNWWNSQRSTSDQEQSFDNDDDDNKGEEGKEVEKEIAKEIEKEEEELDEYENELSFSVKCTIPWHERISYDEEAQQQQQQLNGGIFDDDQNDDNEMPCTYGRRRLTKRDYTLWTKDIDSEETRQEQRKRLEDYMDFGTFGLDQFKQLRYSIDNCYTIQQRIDYFAKNNNQTYDNSDCEFDFNITFLYI